MTAATTDYGEILTIPPNDRYRQPIGLRAYHVPFCRSVTCFIHGFKRATGEKKFRVLAEELAERGCASVGIDLNLDNVQSQLTWDEMLARIRTAEEYLRRHRGWHITSYVGHSLGSCLITQHIYSTMQRERHTHRGAVVMLSPALNQSDLLRYWYQKRIAPLPYTDYREGWSNTHEKRFRATAFNLLPRYAHDLIDSDFSTKTHNLCEPPSTLRISPVPHLLVGGLSDTTVPIESHTRAFRQQILVGGDHDLETPKDLAIWVPMVTNFLAKMAD